MPASSFPSTLPAADPPSIESGPQPDSLSSPSPHPDGPTRRQLREAIKRHVHAAIARAHSPGSRPVLKEFDESAMALERTIKAILPPMPVHDRLRKPVGATHDPRRKQT